MMKKIIYSRLNLKFFISSITQTPPAIARRRFELNLNETKTTAGDKAPTGVCKCLEIKNPAEEKEIHQKLVF